MHKLDEKLTLILWLWNKIESLQDEINEIAKIAEIEYKELDDEDKEFGKDHIESIRSYVLN